MQKQYPSLKELIKETGILDALRIKLLETRAKNPYFNRLCSGYLLFEPDFGYLSSYGNNGRLTQMVHPNCGASFNEEGLLNKLIVRTGGSDRYSLFDYMNGLSDKKFDAKLPKEFAHTMALILKKGI